MSCNPSANVALSILGKPQPPMRQRILTLAFLFPTEEDAFLNRLVARMSKHKVCHAELVFEDDMAFSIFSGGTVFFRQRSFANPDYHVISISVPQAEYQAAYNYCLSTVDHEIAFSNFAMYASYFQPKGCPFLNTANSVQKGSTFCSKIVTEALQFAGNCEVEDLIPCTTTPSCLFAAFQDSQRKVLSSVPYKREQLRQGVLM
jgi:hypothetical protein